MSANDHGASGSPSASPLRPAGEDHGARGVGRRTVVAGVAWSVPAIVAVSATPALAVSGNQTTVSTPGLQVAASGAVTVTASVKNSSGAGVAGQAVSFSGPSGASFTPGTATTDSSGNATTQVNLGTPWAEPGSSVTVTAVVGAVSKSQPLTVIGSNLVAAGAGYGSSPLQTELVFPSPVVGAAGGGAGSTFFLALLQNGTVWAKGSNGSGQLGDGTTTDRSTWAAVSGLSGVTQIAAGLATGYALLSDGSVRAWGGNSSGQVGDGTSGTNRTTPVSVSGLSGVTQIASGAYAGYALSTSGTLSAWGGNGAGQVGDGSTTNRLTPRAVLSGVTQVVAGYNSGYALLSGGTVKAWGYNADGEAGDGTSGTNRTTPVSVSGLSGVKQIASAGYTAFALASDGTVKAWGWNSFGQVGDGTSGTNRTTPVSVSGLSGVSRIVGSANGGYALASDGAAKAWGANSWGAVGDGSTTNRPAPVVMSTPAGHVVQAWGSNSPTLNAALLVMG